MKFVTYSKRFLSLLLILSMLFLACACGDGSDDEKATESETVDSNSTTETDPPLADTDILLSGDKSFRIVYSAGNRSHALKIQDKIMGLDKSYKVGSGKYALVLDTDTPVDGTPEILVGDTNRMATEDAKKVIIGKTDTFVIYATDKAIAIYSTGKDGMEYAIKAMIKNLASKGGSAIYNNASGNVTGTFVSTTVEAPMNSNAKPTEKTTAAEKSSIDAGTLLLGLKNSAAVLPVISISVSTTDSMQSTTVKAGNPCQNCYSVTKVYCVTAIGMLYDEGKIKTTDTIGDIFADEIAAYGIDSEKWANITIHDVMRHEAGFKVGGLLDIDAQDATKWASQDYLKLVLDAELDGKKTDRYTDAAFYLISRVVTKISGEKLDVFLAKRLFNKTECREFAFATCPMGYPIGATGLYIRSEDVAKLGRIYLNGGTYNGERIISQDWVNKVIENGYELNKSGTGYAKGGMRGQYLYINFKHNVSVAWHSYDPNGETGPIGDKLKSYMT